MQRAMILVFLAAAAALTLPPPQGVQPNDKDQFGKDKPWPGQGGRYVTEQVPKEVQEVINTAMRGKTPIMGELNNHLCNYGFDRGTTLQDLRVGTPFHLYKIDIDALKKLGVNSAVATVIKPWDAWEVPLFKEGSNARILILVIKHLPDSLWIAGGFGWNGWAFAWDKINKEWPASAGYHPMFIGQIAGNKYFYVPEMGEKNLTRLFWKINGSRRDTTAAAYSSLDSSRDALQGIFESPGTV